MYPNGIYFGLEVVPFQVLCSQSIYYLGTWTLRVLYITVQKRGGSPATVREGPEKPNQPAAAAFVDDHVDWVLVGYNFTFLL